MRTQQEIIERVKEKIKEDKEYGLNRVTINYVSYVLRDLTSELILSNIERQKLFVACINEVEIDFSFSGRVRTKNTAKKWSKAEAEAHGCNLNNHSFDQKNDVDAMESDSDAD